MLPSLRPIPASSKDCCCSPPPRPPPPPQQLPIDCNREMVEAPHSRSRATTRRSGPGSGGGWKPYSHQRNDGRRLKYVGSPRPSPSSSGDRQTGQNSARVAHQHRWHSPRHAIASKQPIMIAVSSTGHGTSSDMTAPTPVCTVMLERYAMLCHRSLRTEAKSKGGGLGGGGGGGFGGGGGEGGRGGGCDDKATGSAASDSCLSCLGREALGVWRPATARGAASSAGTPTGAASSTLGHANRHAAQADTAAMRGAIMTHHRPPLSAL